MKRRLISSPSPPRCPPQRFFVFHPYRPKIDTVVAPLAEKPNQRNPPPLVSAPVILSVGEVLWDLLPTGAVLGGAPANFAAHAQALGGQVRLVSRVGDDDRGHEILRRLHGRGLSIDLIGVDDSRPTGTVSVTLPTGGQPHYVIHEHVAWDR